MLRSARLPAAVAMAILAALAPPRLGAATVAEVQARGKLVMLCFPHQESIFARVKVEVDLKHYEGIDYEIMEGFARSLGVKLEVRAVKPSFADLIPELLRGRGDVIASYFTITPEREKKVDFSAPYFTVYRVVVVPAASTVSSAADLAAKRAAAVRGSSHDEATRALHPRSVDYVDFFRWTFDAVAEGKADFALQDEHTTWRLLQYYPGLKVAFRLPGEDHYGYAVAPGSDLKDALNRYLETLRASGKLDETIRRHVGAHADSGNPAPDPAPGSPEPQAAKPPANTSTCATPESPADKPLLSPTLRPRAGGH